MILKYVWHLVRSLPSIIRHSLTRESRTVTSGTGVPRRTTGTPDTEGWELVRTVTEGPQYVSNLWLRLVSTNNSVEKSSMKRKTRVYGERDRRREWPNSQWYQWFLHSVLRLTRGKPELWSLELLSSSMTGGPAADPPPYLPLYDLIFLNSSVSGFVQRGVRIR